MTAAPPMPEDPGGSGVAGDPDRPADPIPVALTDHERWLEHALAAAVAVEHARIAGPADSRTTAAYAAVVVGNSRLLCGGRPQQHLNQLRYMVKWLRSLKPGSSELRW